VAPTGYTITKVIGVKGGIGVTNPAIGVPANATRITVEFMSPVGKNADFWIDFEATVPPACVTSRWNPNLTGDVWTGSQIGSGNDFTLVLSSGAPATSTVVGTNSIALALATPSGQSPNTVVDGTPYTATATVSSTCPGGANGVTVNFSGTPNVTVTPTSGTGTTNTSGVVTFTASFGSLGPASLTASAPDLGVSKTLSFTVFDSGVLACNTAPSPTFPPEPGTGYFASLPSGVTQVTDPGFAAGYRLPGDKNEACDLVNYTFTNNILGTNPVDGAGNTLPPNAASFIWDLGFKPNAVYVYVLTFSPEYVDAGTGLPVKQTKFCKLSLTGPTDCTLAANQQNLQACIYTGIGTMFSSASIPGNDPACTLEETWTTVNQSLCPAWTGSGAAPACVRGTTRILDARDPPIIRG
jgi:hypothetical protein